MLPYRTWVFLALLSVVIRAGGDELFLNNGLTVEGEVVSLPNAEMVDVKVSAGGMVGIRHIPRNQVTSIRFGTSAALQRSAALQKRRESLGQDGSIAEWMALAQDARKDNDSILWRSCLGEVLARDRGNEEVHRILGHVLHRGVWMRPDEVAIARGQVQFRSQWVSWNEKERVLAQEAKRRAELLAENDARRRAVAASETNGDYMYPPTVLSPVYRAMYWPGTGGITTGSYHSHNNSRISIQAAGRSDHSRWRFSWNF